MEQNFTFQYIRLPDRRSTFQSRLLHADQQTIVLTQEVHPSAPILFEGKTVMASGYQAIWYLLNGQPYDIACVYRPDGIFTGYYVDILEPVRWEGDSANSLQPLVDLFLDIWIAPDGRYEILDRDEFEAAAQTDALSPQQAAHALHTLTVLEDAIQAGTFPPRDVQEAVGKGVEGIIATRT